MSRKIQKCMPIIMDAKWSSTEKLNHRMVQLRDDISPPVRNILPHLWGCPLIIATLRASKVLDEGDGQALETSTRGVGSCAAIVAVVLPVGSRPN